MIITILNKWLNSSFLPIYGTPTGTSNPGQNEYESNGNDGLYYIPQCSRTGALPSNEV